MPPSLEPTSTAALCAQRVPFFASDDYFVDSEEIRAIAVAPYAAQVMLIRRMLRKLMEVSSTDGFQGREKEVVIFSAVRSNDYGAVGFVSDWRHRLLELVEV